MVSWLTPSIETDDGIELLRGVDGRLETLRIDRDVERLLEQPPVHDGRNQPFGAGPVGEALSCTGADFGFEGRGDDGHDEILVFPVSQANGGPTREPHQRLPRMLMADPAGGRGGFLASASTSCARQGAVRDVARTIACTAPSRLW